MQVEFLGVSRDRAGVDAIAVEADTLGRLLAALAARMPGLADLIVADQLHDAHSASRGPRPSPHGTHCGSPGPRLHPSLVANLNGDRFISDPATPLGDSDRVLILSADVGG
jgi:molybdopterin converting factor small subunit